MIFLLHSFVVIKRIILFTALRFLSILAVILLVTMKQIPIKKFLHVVFILLIMMMPMFLMAGPGDPDCDPLDPTCPIDGGISALLILGAGYGIKKVRDARKANNT